MIELQTIEAHAEGEAGRVVVNAADLVEGATMAERLTFCRENLDDLRRFLLREPRGFPGLCAVLVLPPVEVLRCFARGVVSWLPPAKRCVPTRGVLS